AGAPGSYHAEYGFSTMGYEIAGAVGAVVGGPPHDRRSALGRPHRRVQHAVRRRTVVGLVERHRAADHRVADRGAVIEEGDRTADIDGAGRGGVAIGIRHRRRHGD
ncbi:hypothetical protein EN832_34080, partial [Mesorhizobium sp. M1C.F.Ca.ET.189.01.1.1]